MAENHHSDPSQPISSGKLRWLTVLFLFVVTSLFFWRLTLTNQYTWLDSNDIAQQVLPWFQFQVGELQDGRLPLWDPYPYGGQPLIGQAQPGAAYPLNWLLFAMPTRHGWMRQNILHWYFVLIHFMGVLFAYKLCRDQGRSDAAAVFGGLLFGLGGYMGYVDWPQMLNGAVWAPLILMYLLRVARGQRVWANAAMGGMLLGIALLSGHHQIPAFMAVASGSLWCWLIWQRRPLWPGAAVFFVIAGLTSGLQALPALEYSKLAMRWVGAPEPVGHLDPVPYYVHDQYSFLPVNVVGIAIPGLDPGMSFYVGVVAVFLGMLGIWRGWRWTAVRMATALLAGSLIFAMGAHTVFHGMFYSLLPLVEKARSPLMATLVSLVCLCLLVSYGVDAFNEGLPETAMRRLRWILAGGGSLILAVFWVLYVVRDNGWHQDTRASMAGIVALSLAIVLAGWARGALQTPVLLAALGVMLLIEVGSGGISNEPHRANLRNLPAMATDQPWVDVVRKLGPYERVELSNEDRPHNFGDWNGVDVWHSYLASLTTNIKNMYLHEGRTRELFGVRYALRAKSKPTEEWGEVVDVGNTPGFAVYLNRKALPRAWAVHDVAEAKTYADSRRLMDDRSFDLRQRAFVQGAKAPAAIEHCAGASDDVQLLRRVSDHVRLWADLDCAGLVVLSDTYYPGWEATIDGRPAPIHEVYSSIRGVVTPKGKHWIEMRYRPWSVYLGFVLTLAGALAALVVSRLDR